MENENDRRRSRQHVHSKAILDKYIVKILTVNDIRI
jgi:hypothetical protein